MNTKQKEDTATLEILQAIENQNDVTQRHIADKLNVALGLANSYLKRCVHKGLIKVQQAPANRYLYYLTPKGFSEKSRLTAEYLSNSFHFYRKSSDSLTKLFYECEQKAFKRIVFCGLSELTEIASIRALEHDLTVIGVWEPESNTKLFLDLPIWGNINEIPEFDRCILTALDKASRYYELLIKNPGKEKVMTPSILGVDVSS
jgi:DNA-binding MarR family transcriptional regulator